jgi:plasmid stabilization system protein ParE
VKARKAGASKSTYLVSIAARAERDLAQLFGEIDAENSEVALKWYEGLKEGILSLENLPYRCPVIPEKSRLRHLLYGRKPHVYRVTYRILEKEKRVDVLHIRHGARRDLAAADLG